MSRCPDRFPRGDPKDHVAAEDGQHASTLSINKAGPGFGHSDELHHASDRRRQNINVGLGARPDGNPAALGQQEVDQIADPAPWLLYRIQSGTIPGNRMRFARNARHREKHCHCGRRHGRKATAFSKECTTALATVLAISDFFTGLRWGGRGF
jgi:hypothetical protein